MQVRHEHLYKIAEIAVNVYTCVEALLILNFVPKFCGKVFEKPNLHYEVLVDVIVL